MVEIVFIDVDGTLVGSSGDVHPDVWSAADRARASGIRLVLASGRPGFGITRELAERLDPGAWHTFQNGASIVHLATSTSRSSPLPEHVVAELKAEARAARRLLEIYTDSDYAFEGPPDRARQHADLLGLPFRTRPFDALEGAVVRAQWVVSHDEANMLESMPRPGLEMSASTSPVMPDTRFINMTNAGVTKASAVRILAEEYGVALENIMFAGDGGNDVPAMQIVGYPVAMAESDDGAHAAARYTVGNVDDGGLAQAIDIAIATRT